MAEENNNVSRETLEEKNAENNNNVSRETIEENNTENNNVSRETIDYKENFIELNNSLKKINNNIKELANVEETAEDNSINISSIDNKKVLVDKYNKKLSDYELFKRTLKMIDTDKANNKPVQLSPQFITFMKEYVHNHENNILSDEEFKKQNIFEEIPLSDIVLE